MKFLPIFLNIKDEPCLVVGAGQVAARKIFMLIRANAKVTVISPELSSEIAKLAEQKQIVHLNAEYAEGDVGDYRVVIAATNSRQVNQAVYEEASSKNIPVNVVDSPEFCSFITPSIIDRDPVQIAISTGGSSPVLARLLRSKLETFIPASYGRLGKLVESYRDRVKEIFNHNSNHIRGFWEHVLEGSIADMLISGKDSEAKEALEQAVNSAKVPEDIGEVYLVGAGPGDPDLLTFRALRLMQRADVVVYDRLVSAEILEMVRRDAEFVYVGKARDKHAVKQEGINDLLVRFAKEGKKVLRLKGGDPFIFGRGGEEIETLMENDVSFQVVPGITAAAGCAAYAGIPLTHRDYVQSCTFVTGHLKDGTVNLNWEALAHKGQTIVFYMGLHGVSEICKQLVAHGLDSTTPAALVEKGTTPQQQVHIGSLETLPNIVETTEILPPTLIIVGEVVKLHDKLAWFEPSGAKPLAYPVSN